MIDFNGQENHVKIQQEFERKQKYIDDLNEQVLKNYEVRQKDYFNQNEVENRFSDNSREISLNETKIQDKANKFKEKVESKTKKHRP